jgi:tetratricopeptide (TPR) repeat protein
MGRAELKKEEYDSAIEHFTSAIEENPFDPKIYRDLGIAHYKKGEYEQSIPFLSKAFELGPSDGQTLFHLGTAHEILGNYPEAIDTYRAYSRISGMSSIRKSIEGRLDRLISTQIKDEVKVALEKEQHIDVAAIPENTVAVLYFKNIGKSKELDPLQKGLAEMLITDLSKANELDVIERIRMQKLLEEMGLGMTGIVDQATAPRIGKLLGTSEIVNGSFLDLDMENIRIDAGITEARTAEFEKAEEVTGALEKFFQVEKILVFNIIDQMGISLTQEERDQILTIPTENMLAFLAFCRGLDYEDRGMFQEAIDEYQNALDFDSGFDMAKKKKYKAEAYLDTDIEIAEWIQEIRYSAPVEPLPEATLSDRLEHTEQNISSGFIPGVDSRNPLQEQNQQTFGSTASIDIEVTIP